MLRKRPAKPEADGPQPTSEGRSPAPVNVVIVVESGRKRRARPAAAEDEKGHPLLKTMLGLAVAKRLARPRKRPLAKRVKKAVRKGKRKVAKTARQVRRRLR